MVHAWNGSVVEFRHCLRDLVKRQGVDVGRRVFIDILCLYLPDDVYETPGAAAGLLQVEQMDVSTKLLQMDKRFTRNDRGMEMYVMHSTRCNVYSRSWIAQELAVGAQLELPMIPVLDITMFHAVEVFEQMAPLHRAATSECSRWQDKAKLYEVFRKCEDGGFEAIDRATGQFRQVALQSLKAALAELREQGPS